MTPQIDEIVQIGDFFIATGVMEGNVWIGRNGRLSGEGGDFSIDKLQEVIRAFYEENF